jgi:hypothetical protein
MLKPCLWTLTLLLALLPGIGSAQESPNARRILSVVEQRLLAARYVDFFAHVEIKEPHKRQMSGSMIWDESGKLTGSFRGTIGPDPAQLTISADGKTLVMQLNDEKRSGTQPPALREAILVNLVRAGFAQSLIALSQLHPPERADGGAKDWIQVANVQLREGAQSQGYGDGEIGLQFDLLIGGQPAGRARLWISTQSQLPTRREQFLSYTDADGKLQEIQINESFSRFVVEP